MHKLLKSSLYGVYLILAVLVLLELFFRVYFAFQVSPRVLVYGSDAYENTLGSGRRDRIAEQYSLELEQWQERRAN